jgi:hypothetical protein
MLLNYSRKTLLKLDLSQKRFLYLLSRLAKQEKTISNDNGSQNKKHLMKNGPGLKDFLAKSEVSDKGTSSDEIILSDIFIKNLNNLTSYIGEDQATQKTEHVHKRKVFFEVHGCQMNVNDTEVAYSILEKTGKFTRTLIEKEADVVLIMTCSIRENSEQKIWNKLKDFCHQKRFKPGMQIGILGCMAERLKDKIVNKERMVDVVCGPDSYRLLPSLLEQSLDNGNAAINVQLSLEETYAEISPLRIYPNSKTAYVSIQRGCDNMCSFVRF